MTGGRRAGQGGGRRRWLPWLTLLALLLAPRTAPAQREEPIPAGVPRPPLPVYQPPQPRVLRLDNGLTVLLLVERSLPLTRGLLLLRGGTRDDPPARIGLAALYAQVLQSGGTLRRRGDALDDLLEARAVKLAASAGEAYVSLSFDCLRQDLGEVLGVIEELLAQPALPAATLALARRQLMTRIAAQNDDPQQILEREAQRLGYGPASPYGRAPRLATVAQVTRQDLLAFHRRASRPDGLLLGIVGDFDEDWLRERLRAGLGRPAARPRGGGAPMPGGLRAAPEPPVGMTTPPPARTEGGVYLIEKGDVTQSNIALVGPGLRRDDPDFYAAAVLTQIFGGGATSRLFQHIRSQRGLAYAVSGGIGAEHDHPGLTQVALSTRSDATNEAIDAVYQELDDLQRRPVTEAELDHARGALLAALIFDMDTADKVVAQQLSLRYFGYPPDFLARYRAGIEAVKREDLQRVAARYLRRDRLSLLVVGQPQDFSPAASPGAVSPLARYGAVTRLPLSQ